MHAMLRALKKKCKSEHGRSAVSQWESMYRTDRDERNVVNRTENLVIRIFLRRVCVLFRLLTFLLQQRINIVYILYYLRTKTASFLFLLRRKTFSFLFISKIIRRKKIRILHDFKREFRRNIKKNAKKDSEWSKEGFCSQLPYFYENAQFSCFCIRFISIELSMHFVKFCNMACICWL